MINACLFGAGRMGQSHARHIQQSCDAKLYCIVDPNSELVETVAGKFSVIGYTSAAEALEDNNVDAVVIASNTSTHAELIIASAEAGKPVFCEKPIDLDLEKIDRCLSVVEEAKIPFLVGFNRRFDPTFNTLKERISYGEIGNIETLTIYNRDLDVPDINFLRTSGGLFRDMMIHDFDTARWLLGDEPVEVYAIGGCLIEPRMEEFGDLDTGMVILKTAKGTLCHINSCRRCTFGYDQRIEAFGSKGMLQAKNLSPTTVELFSKGGIIGALPFPSFPQRYAAAYQIEIDHFFTDVVKGNKDPIITGNDGRQAMVIAEAAQQSKDTKRSVKIPIPRKKVLCEAVITN